MKTSHGGTLMRIGETDDGDDETEIDFDASGQTKTASCKRRKAKQKFSTNHTENYFMSDSIQKGLSFH